MIDEMKKEIDEQGLVKTFLNFDKMITPVIIKIIFYISLAICALFGFSLIIRGMGAGHGGGFMVLTGLFTLIISPIIVRVWCEFIVVIFKIHELLVQLNKK
ncbi:DUF4282 domain-containing protein [Serpentinicella sp. ANB-PHB4]|uniref:DUF4282 domain-containing protein n=1 Tax=Serpentinicella sp. ANB-PHB4 TaxID=3074076 RepID=UPI002861926E|nr:DUF4282 domain-containing protein [Serpentinicella sp. ANB-PHB4]MDR5658895.1 DUF4282 domain-containing protein [Serpentinicella sp. ANB-PHB4]